MHTSSQILDITAQKAGRPRDRIYLRCGTSEGKGVPRILATSNFLLPT
jgi:hypothetical protein